MNTVSRLSLLVLAALVVAPGLTSAQTVRVEQDWEITISSPDATTNSPQISLWIKPDPAVDFGGLLQINFRDHPSYSPGGVQLQAWDGASKCAEKTLSTATFGTKGEKITVTVFMETKGGTFTYGIVQGKSPSFGETKSPIFVSLSTTLTSFPNYSTQDTVDNTKIMLGDNRVQGMKINQVRTYDPKGTKKDLGGTAVYP